MKNRLHKSMCQDKFFNSSLIYMEKDISRSFHNEDNLNKLFIQSSFADLKLKVPYSLLCYQNK